MNKKYILLGVLIIAVLAIVELFARYALGLGDPPLSVGDAEMDYVFAPNQNCNRFGNRIAYNNLSMRSDFNVTTNAGQRFLFVVGDSVINGGVLTDQSALCTTILQKKLDPTSKRLCVCNVSAGSWGPGNYAAYFRRYKEYVRTSDILVVEVNSHDLWEDDPLLTAGRHVGIDIALPDHKPWCATWDGINRYFMPRLWKWFGSAHVNTKVDVPKWQTDAGNNAAKYNLRMLDEIFSLPCARKALLIYRSRKESREGIESVGEHEFRRWAESRGAAVINAELDAETDYRDAIHPAANGQRKLADAIEAWL